MPFCTECGEKMKVGERYCSQCGAPMIVSKHIGSAQNPKKLFLIAGAFILFALLIILITQTDRNAHTTNFKVGTRHEYSLNNTISGSSQTHTMIINIESEEIINEKKYFKRVTDIIGLHRETIYVRQGGKRVYALEEGYLNYPEYLLSPLPLSVGKTWTVDNLRGTTLHYRVESRENVDVEGQTYRNCYKLVFYGEAYSVSVEGYEYFHSDIGTVKFYTVMEDLGVTSEAVLKNYFIPNQD